MKNQDYNFLICYFIALIIIDAIVDLLFGDEIKWKLNIMLSAFACLFITVMGYNKKQ